MKIVEDNVAAFATCAIASSLVAVPLLGWTAPAVTIVTLLLGGAVLAKLSK
ncbi:MAG: hypothetical protein ACLQNE_22425 [Thermoguttaceae bacterium]